MIKDKVVNELVQMSLNDYPITSAYFSVASKSGNRKAHLVEFKKMIRYKKNTTYFKQLSESEQESVLTDFEKILYWFEEELDTSTYMSSICFSSGKSGFWKTIDLKIPLTNELIVQPKPYIYQLTKLFSSYSRYGVVLVDKSKARIFEQSLGNFKELFHVDDNSPDTVKVGGFKGRQERKVERNIRQGVIQHYKEVARKIFDLNKSRDFNWIVLGGRKETIGEFRKYLHDYVDTKVAGVLDLEQSATLSEVFEKVHEVGKNARLEFDKKLLETYNNKKEANQAIEGIKAILPKIRDNWIDTLILHEDYQQKGVFCRRCNYIDLSPAVECPDHGGPLERTHNIVEHILHNILQQGVNVQYVGLSMKKYGEIAAILRFPIIGRP